MSDAAIRHPVERIEVHVVVGDERMAGTVDPVFFGLRGPNGREFRLALHKGHAFRRGEESHFVLGPPDLDATNVEHPDLNDPTHPPLCADDVASCYLRKGTDPIPNVRGLGEMDDRIQVVSVEVAIHATGLTQPRRFARQGPLWLGLVSGSLLEVPPAADGS